MLNGRACAARRFMLKVGSGWSAPDRFGFGYFEPQECCQGLRNMPNMLVRSANNPDMSTLHALALSLHSALVVSERKETPPQKCLGARARTPDVHPRPMRATFLCKPASPGGRACSEETGWRRLRSMCGILYGRLHHDKQITGQLRGVRTRRLLHANKCCRQSIFSYIALCSRGRIYDEVI